MVLPLQALPLIPGIQISPLGVVPQRDRRPRVIVDFTWSKINQATPPIAPNAAMQFGRVLPRILWQIVYADPRHGPIYLCKIDISDGFYRISLNPDTLARLGVILPTTGEPLLAFPLKLPMGWVSSPPYFCAMSETTADLANKAIQRRERFDIHPLSSVADASESAPAAPHHFPREAPAHPTAPRKAPLGTFDVYMDDFIGLAQGSLQRRTHLRSVMFHTIHQVLRKGSATDNPRRQEPISIKKLQKGDAHWDTKKTILGWDIDTIAQTIALPPHRAEKLKATLSIPTTVRRVKVKQWQQVLGELRSISLAIPGIRGLYSVLQDRLNHPTQNYVYLNSTVHQVLADITTVVTEAAQKPMHLKTIIPTPNPITGATDAAATGMGGFFFTPHGVYAWRLPFPLAIPTHLVSEENPQGTLTNSDLELCAILAQCDLISKTTNTHHKTLLVHSDNVAAISWLQKGSTATSKVPARLLRLHALQQRHFQHLCHATYIPGDLNTVADILSRWHHLSDTALLAFLNTQYRQSTEWELLTPTEWTSTTLISALLAPNNATPLALHEIDAKTRHGKYGNNIASTTASTPLNPTYPSPLSSFSQLVAVTERSLSEDNPSKVTPWQTTYTMLERRTSTWASPTLDLTSLASFIQNYNGSTELTEREIHHLLESNPALFKSSTKSTPVQKGKHLKHRLWLTSLS